MMSADDEILQRQPKGFNSNSSTVISPDRSAASKKKNISFSLRRVTPDKNDPMSTPTMSSNKKLFGGLRGNNNSGSGRGKRGVRSIEKQQKMQDEYYDGYADDGDNAYNHAEEQLDDGELPSLSPLAKGGRLVPLSPPRRKQHPHVMSPSKTVRMAEDSPTAIVASNLGTNRNVIPASETDYETLKVAGFWSQLDAADDDDSSDYGKSSASSHRTQEEEMPNDERQWRRSQSPARNRGTANSNAPATNPMGLSLVQNTSTESTIKTEVIDKTNNNLDDSESDSNGNGGDNNAGANGGWNLLEMSRFFAADNRQSEQEGKEAFESQGLDRSYNPNARMVAPSNGNGERAVYEDDEEEGIIENICVQLGNICGFGDGVGASNNKQYGDGDSVFENLDGQEDVAIELGYVEPEEGTVDVVALKKKKKGWKSFLGIKKKSPPRKTLVTETTMSGREPVDGDTTKVSDLNVAQTYSGNGLNPLDDLPASVVGAAAAAVAAAGTAAIFGNGSYIDDDDEELESQAAGWDAKRKNMYLRQLASQAKAQHRIASNSFDGEEEEEVNDEEEDTTINRPETPETYTADYTNFNPSDKSKFLRFLNAGMSPQDATRAVIEERDAVVEEEEGYVDDESEEVPRSARHFPNNDEIVSVQSEDPPGVRKGQSGESAELSARDADLDGLIDELENQPASQSEMAGDSKATPLEAYQDRAVIPMVPAVVSAKKKSKSRPKQEEEGVDVENQDGLAPSGIQYYDAVSEDKNDEDVDYDDSNSRQKRSQHIGRPRLGTSIASSFAAKVASKRFESTGKNKSKYGKVSERPSVSEEASDSPSVPRVVSMPSPEKEEQVDNNESSSVGGDEVSLSKPKTNVFDLMQRKKNKKFSKLESDGFTALPSMSAKSDEDDLPSWARNTSRDTETVTSAFSPPIENMDVEQVEDHGIVPEVQQEDDVASTPDDEITEAEYDEDTVSLMGQTFMTGASGYSRRRRRKGVARTRVASAKEAESQAGAKSKGWMDSIQEAASKNGQVWHPEKGWVNYSEPDEELQGSENYGSIGTLQGPQNDPSKSIPLEAQAQVVGFTTPRSVTVTEFDDQSVVTKLTVNTAAESPTILTTSTAPTRRAGRKPRPTDQRKIAAAHANKPIGWKDSMENAANGVDNGGFRWDFEKGWIRIDGSSIDDDEASALTESVFYNEGQDLDQPPKPELLPVTEENADEFSDDDEDVFNDIDQKNEVDMAGGSEDVGSFDSSEKENSHANKISETESHGREDYISKEKLDPVQISNTLLDRIMAAEPKEPVFISTTEDIEEASAKEVPAQERGTTLLDRIMAAEPEKPVFGRTVAGDDEQSVDVDEISREPSGIGASQFVGDEVDELSEVEPSRDPSGDRVSQFNSVQEDPSGKAGNKSSSSLIEAPIHAPSSPKKSLNTWLESSNATTPNPHNDNTSRLREESVNAVKTVEPPTKTDSFTLESFEDEEVFGSTQVVKEKFSDTESELFQPFEAEIKKNTFESFESQGSAENDWVSTTLKRQSPVTTSDEVSQKARVWMDSMKNDEKTEELSESGSYEPRVNKLDPPQNVDPPTSHLERIKKRPASSWIKAKDKVDEEPPQKEEKPLPPVESNVGSLRSKFESKKNDVALEGNDENVVVFKSQAMGIRLKRGEDGFVRVVSVTQAAFGSSIDRVGLIEPGDTIKEAAGIDLRSPITNSQWGEAVTQIRNTPRPMTFIVAAGVERKSSTSTSPNPAIISTAPAPPSHNVVEYDLTKTSNGDQAVQSVKEYRRHYSPERAGISAPNRRQYGTPDHKQYKHSLHHDSPDRSVYTEASSVFSEDLPTKDSFFNRIAACATAGAAACTTKQRTTDDTEKNQVPMAHLKFLRTNPTITRVTNAAKNRLVCGRPDTIFEETGGDPAYDLGRTKSNASVASGDLPRGDKIVNDSREYDRSRTSSVRAGKRTTVTVGDNTAFLENLAMNSPVTSKLNESKKDEISARPKLMVQSYLSEGGEVGWPEENEAIAWEKDTIENVSTVSAHSTKKKETAIKAEMLAAAKVEAMMEDLDHDEDSECEI